MTAHAAHLTNTPLAEVDARIASAPRGALTLSPSREAASRLCDLVASLTDSHQQPVLAAAASSVAESQLESFPENLFWDFDFYLASVHLEGSQAEDYGAHVAEVSAITVNLMRMYGQQSTIRFRYVHDFIYGFDWARWVRRAPGSRRSVGPFSLDFLRQVETRGRDLLLLIEEDDDLYPKLVGPGSRNPFPFFREPDDELRLYRRLATSGCIPVEAWRADARPDASRDFDGLREDAAKALGLTR